MQNFGGYTLEIWTFRRGRMRENSSKKTCNVCRILVDIPLKFGHLEGAG